MYENLSANCFEVLRSEKLFNMLVIFYKILKHCDEGGRIRVTDVGVPALCSLN